MPNDDAPLKASGYFQISLRGEEGDYPSLMDVSSFLYDFNLLYEFSRLIVDPQYADYKFSRYSGYRTARRIRPEDRLLVERLSVQSPIELTVVLVMTLPSAAAIWALTQAFEKMANFRINREILKLQRDVLKLQRDSLKQEPERSDRNEPLALPDTDHSFRERTRVREADYYFGRVEEHLRDAPIRIKEMEITHVRELPAKSSSKRDPRS